MIAVNNIEKIFCLYKKPSDRLKEIIFRKQFHREFYALRDVSFHVAEGETLGIIGGNGAGKSTLLKILTGVLMPDGGSYCVNGRITGLLELGTGFNPEFTGIQNIHMNAAYLGLSKREIDDRRDDIVAFSELGDFISEPIKTYSSGMIMRLAFSTAIHADPQCFVVDEALAVGDAYFQQKCMQRLKAFRSRGGSIVFVSHDMNAVKVLCDWAVLLDKGMILEIGDPEKIINTYNFLLAKKGAAQEINTSGHAGNSSAYGNHKARIENVELRNSKGIQTNLFMSGEQCTMEITVRAEKPVEELTIGILIRDRFGQDIFGTNTFHLNHPLSLAVGEEKKIWCRFDEFNIGPGKYTLTVALHSLDVHIYDCYHWVDRISSFEVVQGSDFFFNGLCRLKPSFQIT